MTASACQSSPGPSPRIFVYPLAQLRAHLKQAHHLPARALSGPEVSERLQQYRIREADGLVQRWIHGSGLYGLGSGSAQRCSRESAHRSNRSSLVVWYSGGGPLL